MRRLACTVLAVTLAGCGAKAGAPLDLPSSPADLPRSNASHVVVIVMENREYGEVIGDASSPYVNGLAGRGALATNYYAIGHPSLPNYIALLAGSQLGIHSDCTDCSAPGLALPNQLDGAGVSWRAYLEDMPAACYRGAGSGGYAKKHNPFIYFGQIADNPGRCAAVVPLTRLAGDLRSGRLPAFAWISPNLCDDGHDCSNATADRFLARLVPFIMAGLGSHGWLAVTWDEGTSEAGCCRLARGGHVPLVLVGPDVRAGRRIGAPADHYSLLGLIEDAFGLPRLRGAACRCTPSVAQAFRGGSRRLR
jgi:predicted small lipoprotein YifL